MALFKGCPGNCLLLPWTVICLCHSGPLSTVAFDKERQVHSWYAKCESPICYILACMQWTVTVNRLSASWFSTWENSSFCCLHCVVGLAFDPSGKFLSKSIAHSNHLPHKTTKNGALDFGSPCIIPKSFPCISNWLFKTVCVFATRFDLSSTKMQHGTFTVRE